MSLQDIEWTESEGDTDDNLDLQDFNDSSEDEQHFNRAVLGRSDQQGRTRKTREEDLDPEVEEAYQEARNLYTNGDYDSALILLEEAVKHESGSKLLYNLLANIHEERQDMEKALLARIAVAHLEKRDKDTWIDIAERSVQLGYLAQAAVFYQHVSRLDRDNWRLLRTRADLHTQLGETSSALTLLQRIRSKFFKAGESVGLNSAEKTEILLNIAGSLKDLGRLDEATQIYLDIFNRSIAYAARPGVPKKSFIPGGVIKPEVELDWQNLNVLCELLLEQKLYLQIVTMTKDGARWIKGRGSELYWQTLNASSDGEFDSRRFQLYSSMTSAQKSLVQDINNADQYEIPIDIRIWLLESRLKMIPSHLLLKRHNLAEIESLSVVEDAISHLEELRKHQPVEEYSDLYQRAAVAFFDARLYSEARELYTHLTGIAHETIQEYLEMNVQVAKCEMELHNVQRAENLYQFVLEKDPDNQEALVAMCEIYSSTNRIDEFQKTLNKLEYVRTIAENLDENLVGIENEPGSSMHLSNASSVPPVDRGAGNVFVDNAGRHRTPARLTRAKRAELERNAQDRADNAFSGLARNQSGLDSGNKVAIMEWLRYADELVEMFASHRKFFPVSRQKEFFSFEGSSSASVDQRMERLRLARDDQVNEDLDENLQQSKEDLEESYVWRGQPLSFWFWVLVQCSIVHAENGDGQKAQHTISIAQAANVFNLNSEKKDTMDFVAISCAYVSGDLDHTCNLWRHLQSRLQFNTVTYQLYMALFASGQKAIDVFASSNNQKFFLRQIKALDSLVHTKKHVLGMAKVLDPDSAPTSEDPQLLMLYVYIMLQGPSYSPALTYLIRCREQLRYHPLVLLVYAVVQIHRSTQRTSLNRHTQLLEGLSFMQDYEKYRLEGNQTNTAIKVEVLYNLGRFFHSAGLLTVAARYYEDALEICDESDEEYNIGREAAYNLQLIYLESSNPELSLKIINKYLVI